MSLFDLILVPQAKQRQAEEKQLAEIYRSLVHWEAKVGGGLFGPIPEGVRREFFCLDEHTWVWHEEWTDQSGKRRIVTTRYDVRPNGVFKSQGTNSYQALSAEEAVHLRDAVNAYCEKVVPELQRIQHQN